MNAPRTVRDVPDSVYLPALADFLKKLNLFQLENVDLPHPLRAQFELWFYKQVANIIHKLYLTPSMIPAQVAPSAASNSKQLRVYLQAVTKSVMWVLLQSKLLVRDRTGLFLISETLAHEMEAIVRQINF
jgi:hypothetical protein